MSEENSMIEGAVAKILNSRELVLNVGRSAGVDKGMYFDILDPRGENIKDPFTDEVLESLRRSKVRVKVTDVREKISVATTFKNRRVNVGGNGLIDFSEFSRSLLPPQWVVRYETLRADDEDWEDLEEKDSYVKVGDPAIQVQDSKSEG